MFKNLLGPGAVEALRKVEANNVDLSAKVGKLFDALDDTAFVELCSLFGAMGHPANPIAEIALLGAAQMKAKFGCIDPENCETKEHVTDGSTIVYTAMALALEQSAERRFRKEIEEAKAKPAHEHVVITAAGGGTSAVGGGTGGAAPQPEWKVRLNRRVRDAAKLSPNYKIDLAIIDLGSHEEPPAEVQEQIFQEAMALLKSAGV